LTSRTKKLSWKRSMNNSDHDPELWKLLGKARRRQAPEELRERILAQARQEVGTPGGGLFARGRDWFERMMAAPRIVWAPVAVAALAAVLAVSTVMVSPEPEQNPAQVEARPAPADPPQEPEAVPPQLAALTEQEFEMVLVLDDYLETEESALWSEDSQYYF
jgi:hypothetical protein